MKIYRLSQPQKRKRRLIDYYSCMLAIKNDSDPDSPVFDCVEEFLDRIQTVEGINELRGESRDWHYNMDEVLRVYVSDNRDLLSEKDIRRIVNFAIITDQLFKGGTREYLVKLFWSQDLPKDLAYQLYGFMTNDKLLVNSTYCNYILSNSAFPPELLADALAKYPKAPIAEWASENENVPLDALMEWRRKTGRIKEEEQTSVTEKVEEPKPNEPLNKLLQLVGNKSVRFIKSSASEEYYNPMLDLLGFNAWGGWSQESSEAFFRTISDPSEYSRLEAELKKVYGFSLSSNFNVKFYIEDVLKFEGIPLTENAMRTIVDIAMKSGDLFKSYSPVINHAYISHFFGRQPKLPEDLFRKLYSLIKAKKIDNTQYLAVLMTNPHIPKDILVDALFSTEVFEWVREWASENSSLPPELKIKYLQDRGEISSEGRSNPTEEVAKPKFDNLAKLEELQER